MKHTRRNKILIITGSLLLLLVLLLLGAGLYLESRADEIIGREFTKLTHGRYKLRAGDIGVSLFNRSVRFTDLKISPANGAATSTTADAQSGPLLDFSAEQLFVSGIHFNRKDGKLDISLRKLQLKSPHVKYIAANKEHGDNDTTGTSRFRVSVKRIAVSNGYVEQSTPSRPDTIRNLIEGVDIEIGDFLLDSDADGYRQALGDNTSLNVSRITHVPADGSTRLEIDSVHVGTRQGLVSIASFAIIPTYSKEEFAVKSWHHKDWSRAGLWGISFHGVDFARFLKERELYIDSVHIGSGGFSSYKNRNVARKEWIKPLHYQIIQRLPIKFHIRTASLADIQAQYEELAVGADRPGIITFEDIGGEIYGLSNIVPSGEKYSKWVLSASLQDKAPINVTGFMPVDSLTNRWELMAVLGLSPATMLNTMITPLTNVEITSGEINKMYFHMTGNSTEAHIDMTFLYDNLEVALLKDKDGHLEKRGFLSDVVNDMVLLQSNPLHGQTRQAHGEFTRDPYRSAWNYLWKTIFSGIKDAVGLGKL